MMELPPLIQDSNFNNLELYTPDIGITARIFQYSI